MQRKAIHNRRRRRMMGMPRSAKEAADILVAEEKKNKFAMRFLGDRLLTCSRSDSGYDNRAPFPIPRLPRGLTVKTIFQCALLGLAIAVTVGLCGPARSADKGKSKPKAPSTSDDP